jgi:YVTN family beta-propeller protein
MFVLVFLLSLFAASGAEYAAPAGTRTAARRPGAESILPGGRMIAPLGLQYATGPGPFGLAVNANARMVVTADGGPGRYSLTALIRDGRRWEIRQVAAPRQDDPDAEKDDWRSVFMGLAFAGERSVWASEGNSGRVRLVHMPDGKVEQIYDLNQNGFRDSYTGDLALDRARRLLYVVDQANFRVAVIDLGKKRIAASLRVGRMPFAAALSPDGQKLYVTHVGMFEYKAIAGADPKRILETGLPFPAFGFPSKEAAEGARRETASGSVDVPGLGDPNLAESNSLAVVDVSNAEAPRIERFVRTGLPFGGKIMGGSSPSGVLAAGGRVYVSNGHNDSISVIDPSAGQKIADIPIRIPGLEQYRGVLPIGLAYDAKTGWLLVAEAGINAVGVIDTRSMKHIAHLPAGWFPTRVVVEGGTVYVSNAKGHGTGPNATEYAAIERSFQAELRRGTVSIYPMPGADDLEAHTARVLELNGFAPLETAVKPLPKALRRVVIIVKENRTFDEVFGDIESASNGTVNGAPMLARFSRYAMVSSPRGGFRSRNTLRNVNVTPNHHEMAARWAFSDNFYADSEVSVDGHHWIVGSYPNAWTQSTVMAGGQKNFRFPTTAPGRLQFPQSNSSIHPEEQLEAGALWHHLERHGIKFRNYGEGFELAGVHEEGGMKPTGARLVTNVPMPDPLYRNTSRDYPQYNTNIPDQYRAAQFIREIEEKYIKGGEEFPRLLFIHLPNDHMSKPRPEDGYPFTSSYVADNDYALGRIVEFLSKTPWWREMAVLVTEDDAQGGVDHVDSHRTVFLALGPYARKNYVSHVNSSFPGLLKTAFRILGIPPLNLYDAAAADLGNCFTDEPDFTPFRALPINPLLFDPAKARDPLDPVPGPAMDDPNFLREQHRR